MNFHQSFEVLDSFDSEFQGGVIIAHKEGVLVHLEGRDGPPVTHTFLDGLVQGKCLVGSSDQDHHLHQTQFQSSCKNTNNALCKNCKRGATLRQVLLYTSLASMTVPTPTVRAVVGTFDTSSPKNRALALMVSTARDLILVLEDRDDPGSLNAMCPSGPMPGDGKNFAQMFWSQSVAFTHHQ